MERILLTFSMLCYTSLAFCQLLINGASVHFTPGSQVLVSTDSLLLENNATLIQNGFVQIDKDLVNNSGTLTNDGVIDINESLINNDQIEGLNFTSNFLVQEDWINNNVFIPGQSTVLLDGAVQNILGNAVTTFYNLECLGTQLDVKQLSSVNAQVLGILDLGNVEFATNLKNLSVLNPNINAIVRNDGFVSSLDTGRLNRTTNSVADYLFPVGSSSGGTFYRPIVMNPNNATGTLYGVRFANLDASLDGFDVLSLEDSLCLVNDQFYHRIYGSSAADIEMFYDVNEDGDWTDMAHWQNVPQWQDMGAETPNSLAGFQTLQINNWNDFANPAFALAISSPSLDAGNDIQMFANQFEDINPVYLGPAINNLSWTPAAIVDCADCLNIEVSPFETTTLVVGINEGERCAIYDTVLITVIPEGIFIPSGFTPNSDGVNDIFKPMNTNIDYITLSVWNRWGEKVFETTDPFGGWDGTYKGTLQNPGVFTYYAEYKLIGQTKEHNQKGSITLIR